MWILGLKGLRVGSKPVFDTLTTLLNFVFHSYYFAYRPHTYQII